MAELRAVAFDEFKDKVAELLGKISERKIAPSKIDVAFIKGEYKDSSGKSNPMYYLNRDAFFQVVLGFTGKEASKLRWNFIQEFNKMEQALKRG